MFEAGRYCVPTPPMPGDFQTARRVSFRLTSDKKQAAAIVRRGFRSQLIKIRPCRRRVKQRGMNKNPE